MMPRKRGRLSVSTSSQTCTESCSLVTPQRRSISARLMRCLERLCRSLGNTRRTKMSRSSWVSRKVDETNRETVRQGNNMAWFYHGGWITSLCPHSTAHPLRSCQLFQRPDGKVGTVRESNQTASQAERCRRGLQSRRTRRQIEPGCRLFAPCQYRYAFRYQGRNTNTYRGHHQRCRPPTCRSNRCRNSRCSSA